MTAETIDMMLICATIIMLVGMWFLTMLTVLAVEKPENVAKILTSLKGHRSRE